MYIARTGKLLDTGKDLEQRFYILDEDNDYRLIKGVSLRFPLNTTEDEINDAIAKVVKQAFESDNGVSPLSLQEIKRACLQSVKEKVLKVNDKLNGIS